MIKIYPSSYAPPAGISTNAEYNSGCIRYQLFKDDLNIPRGEIHPLYGAIGVIGEMYQLARLKDITHIELPIKHQLADNAYISGRIDALDENYIYEFKTSVSKSTYSQVIRKGEYKLTHLGQLVTYLCTQERTKGKLIYAYAHFDKKLTGLMFENRDFDIELDNGTIIIDGEDSGHTVNSMMQFYTNIVNAYNDPAFPPATTNDNACQRCPLQDLCAFGPKEKEAFSREVKCIKGEVENNFEPKINIHDTRR